MRAASSGTERHRTAAESTTRLSPDAAHDRQLALCGGVLVRCGGDAGGLDDLARRLAAAGLHDVQVNAGWGVVTYQRPDGGVDWHGSMMTPAESEAWLASVKEQVRR